MQNRNPEIPVRSVTKVQSQLPPINSYQPKLSIKKGNTTVFPVARFFQTSDLFYALAEYDSAQIEQSMTKGFWQIACFIGLHARAVAATLLNQEFVK